MYLLVCRSQNGRFTPWSILKWPGRGPWGRPGASESGPKILDFRMVPKVSILFWRACFCAFDNGSGTTGGFASGGGASALAGTLAFTRNFFGGCSNTCAGVAGARAGVAGVSGAIAKGVFGATANGVSGALPLA